MSTREELLSLIDNSIEDSNSWIDDVLSKLGWSKDYLFQKDIELVSCPINPGHKMPRSSLELHMKYCPLLSKGYSRDEIDSIIDTDYCYENSNVVVKVTIDENEFREVMKKTAQAHGGFSQEIQEMPVTIERAEKVLSREQRLALHEYIVEKAKKIRPKQSMSAEDFMLLDDTKKDDSTEPKSRLELLAMQRDLKRRRQSYRAKNVHITKKNYTEVLRAVIQNQMEAWVAVTTEAKGNDNKQGQTEQDSKKSHDQTERSRSRSIQRDYRGYGRDRTTERPRRRSPERSNERYSRRSPDSRYEGSKRSRDRSTSREQYSHKRNWRESRSRSRDRGKRSKEKKHRDSSREPSYSSRTDDYVKSERHESDSEGHSSKKHKKHKKHKHHKKKDK